MNDADNIAIDESVYARLQVLVLHLSGMTEVALLIPGPLGGFVHVVLTAANIFINFMVKVASDIQCLLKRRMEIWKLNNFKALLSKAECRDAQCRGRQPRMNDDHVARVFTRLMLRGRVQEAVRFVTD